MFRQYNQWKERKLHPSQKTDPETFQRANFAVDFAILVIPTVIGYGIYHYWVGYLPGLIAMIFILVFDLLMIAYFLKTGNRFHWVWGNIIVSFIGISIFSYYSGGFLSSTTTWYILAIFSSFLVGSQRVGLIYSAFILFWMIVLYPLTHYIFGEPKILFPEEHFMGYNFASNLGIILFIITVVLAYEVTRTNLKKQLAASNQKLIAAEKMASLGQLTAGIAHEINNPVNFVNGNAEAIQKDVEELAPLFEKIKQLKNDEDLENALKEFQQLYKKLGADFIVEEIQVLTKGITEGSERIHQIVNGLRTFSHESSEGFVPTNLEEGLRATLTILNNKIKHNQIQVDTHFANLTLIKCDGGKINQVFLNIMDNAIQSMPDGGFLKVETFLENNFAKIKISDTGTGIPEAILKKVFEPFFTTKEVGKGTGLGLSICYGIMEEHQGKIELESEVGKGTICVISIPVK